MIRTLERNRETLNRRELLTRTAPVCAMACLGLRRFPTELVDEMRDNRQEVHKFDVLEDMRLSIKSRIRMEYVAFFDFVKTLKVELGEPELIRLLKIDSSAFGQRRGEAQAREFADTSFQTFVSQFRPPRFANILSHEVIEDSESAFGLRVTECVIASVFREVGLDGEIGHAAVCNMDYTWPTAFNPDFKMERNRTLMQGHDQCNHRYINADKWELT